MSNIIRKAKPFLTCQRLDELLKIEEIIKTAPSSELDPQNRQLLLEFISDIQSWKKFVWSSHPKSTRKMEFDNLLQILNKYCEDLSKVKEKFTRKPTLHEKNHLVEALELTNGNLKLISAVPLEHFHHELNEEQIAARWLEVILL